MKKTKSAFFGISLSSFLLAWAPWQSWLPHLGEPPYDPAMWSSERARISFVGVSGYIDAFLQDTKLGALWMVPAGDSQNAYQEFPLSYYPTSVEGVGGGRVLVAGKRPRGGNTVVELWDFQAPNVLYPQPAGTPVVQTTTVNSITTLYDEASQGKDMVRLMSRLLHITGDAALVQFWDSRDVYEMDFTDPHNATLTPVASPSPGVAPLTVSSLGVYDFDVLARGNHPTFGQLYMFSFLEPVPSPTFLYLHDSDYDGAIETFDTANKGNWQAKGYAVQYLDWD